MDIANTKTKISSRYTQGYIICIFAIAMWASTAVFIRYLTETYHLPAMVLAFWRDLFVTIAMLLALRFLKPELLHVPRVHRTFLILYGLDLAIFNSLWTFSVALNGAAVSTVLAYSSAAYTAVLGWRLFHESLTLPKIVAVSMGLLGCVFVSGAYNPAAWQLNLLGIITGILSGMAFASYSLMGKSAANRGINSWSALLYAFMGAAFFLLLYNLLRLWIPSAQPAPGLFWLGRSWSGWLVLIILAVGPTIGGYGLYTLSLNYLPVSVANLVALMEPVITAILAFFFLGEIFNGMQLFGGALIVSSVLLLRLWEGRAAGLPAG